MADTDRIDETFKWGWRPQLPSIYDVPLNKSFILDSSEIPDNYDPTGLFLPTTPNKWPACYNQGRQGSCVAQGAAALIHFYCLKTNYPWKFTPSRAFIYYNTRVIMGTEDEDSGAYIRDGIKAINKWGTPPEDGDPRWSMPYSDKDYKSKPTEIMYKNALLHCALEYQLVPQQSDAIKSLLAKDIPIEFGFVVYSNFMTKKVQKSGIMPKPGIFDTIEGGHAVDLVGYLTNYPAGEQNIVNWAIVRNSWGIKEWGIDGYFLMPWREVLLNSRISSDFWCLTSVGFKKAA